MKRLANLISFSLHPLIMPSLGVLLIGHFRPFPIIPEVYARILLITFLGTYVLPGIVMILLYLLGIISDLNIRKSHERSWPLLISGICFYSVYHLIRPWPLSAEFIGFFAGVAISVFIALIINRWIKVSLHMIGAGGMIGLSLALNALLGVSEIWPAISSIIAAGMIGSSRLYLQAHRPFEIYLGLAVGCVSVIGGMIMA